MSSRPWGRKESAMSTSAERTVRLRDGTTARLRPLPYDHPVAQYLVEQVQQEYVQRYGGRDAAVVEPGEFVPPRGVFLVAEVDGVPAGCGAWRVLSPGVAGVKRGDVEPRLPPRGFARVLLAPPRGRAPPAGPPSRR